MKKTVIITGASRGIGAACAELFAVRGFNTVINYNSSEECALALERDLAAHGYSVMSYRADVSRRDEVKAMFEAVYSRFGAVDVLINNAGISGHGLITMLSYADEERLMSVNFGGVLNCCRETVSYMLNNHSGAIVNISSMWGEVGASCESMYSATKSAVIGLTKSLAKELGPSGIRVNCVAPGVIDTEMNSSYSREDMKELADSTPLMRIGKPSEVAEAVYFLSTEASSFITGQVLGVNGGFVI